MGIAPPDQWVLDAGDLLDHAHIQDNDTHGNRHWGIGDGYRIDWRAFFRALWTAGMFPRLVLQLHDLANIMPSML